VTRRLAVLYLAVAFGPVLAFAAAFAVRDLFAGKHPAHQGGNGHAEIEGLEHTVEEARAP